MKIMNFFLFMLLLFNNGSSQHSLKIENGIVKTKDNIHLYYTRIGTGSEVVIIPAGMYLEDEFKRLASQKRTIIFYDQRGRGNSSRIADKEKLGIEYEISDLESIRNHFKYEKISLIGWSYLGAVVALYTIKYPHYVNRAIQIGPIVPRKVPYWEQYETINSSRLVSCQHNIVGYYIDF